MANSRSMNAVQKERKLAINKLDWINAELANHAEQCCSTGKENGSLLKAKSNLSCALVKEKSTAARIQTQIESLEKDFVDAIEDFEQCFQPQQISLLQKHAKSLETELKTKTKIIEDMLIQKENFKTEKRKLLLEIRSLAESIKHEFKHAVV